MPSATVWVHEATGLRWPSTSTRHCRQAPAGASSGWSQNRGIAMPICSATRITSVALGAVTSMPSMVSVTVSTLRDAVMSSLIRDCGACVVPSVRPTSACAETRGAVRPSM